MSRGATLIIAACVGGLEMRENIPDDIISQVVPCRQPPVKKQYRGSHCVTQDVERQENNSNKRNNCQPAAEFLAGYGCRFDSHVSIACESAAVDRAKSAHLFPEYFFSSNPSFLRVAGGIAFG